MLQFMKSLGRMPCNVLAVRLEDAFAYEDVFVFSKKNIHMATLTQECCMRGLLHLAMDYGRTQQTTLVYEKSPVTQRQNNFFEVKTKRKRKEERNNES